MKINEHGFVQISKEKNGKNYILFVPQGAQYGECYDVLYELLQDVLSLAKKSVEDVRPKETEVVDSEDTGKEKGV
jgi:hypothetical protein